MTDEEIILDSIKDIYDHYNECCDFTIRNVSHLFKKDKYLICLSPIRVDGGITPWVHEWSRFVTKDQLKDWDTHKEKFRKEVLDFLLKSPCSRKRIDD